ncbi:MAG TPA: GNAT family N-acetyltransferase [Patescibacteria group bacterium]|nr:GNAT family N-acetyltransferase [Patescibacteria group bacterium]
MDINIREAKPEDWQILQTLNKELFVSEKNNDEDLFMDFPTSEEGIKYFKDIASQKGGIGYIAYMEGKPAGFILLNEKHFSYRRSKYIEVESLGVDPEYRSKGVGRLLIEKAGEWAKKQNASRLFVSVYWLNKLGINFYKKNGFYEIGIEMDKKL